ncbi:MAG: DUF4392 domain-containing protein [Candidatus Hodarchaeota archaeon]
MEKFEPKIERIGTEIDNTIKIDITCRGIIEVLYKAAREKIGGPLTMSAAAALKREVNPGNVVLIATGFPARSWLVSGLTETDGPVGAAVLARAVNIMDAVPVILTEESIIKYSAACCRGAGLIVTDLEKAVRSKPLPRGRGYTPTVALEKFPVDQKLAREAAEKLIAELKPKAIIAVEMPSQNEKGVYHTARGEAVPSELVAKIDYLFNEANAQKILTIGIGDGGNEIGMGVVRDITEKYVPHGSKCVCPCGSGIAAATEAEILVAAVVSNWGACGITASLSYLLNNPSVLPSATLVRRILTEAANVGTVDGSSGCAEASEDGVPGLVSSGVINIMRTIVGYGLKGHPLYL